MKFRKNRLYYIQAVDHYGHLGSPDTEHGSEVIELVGRFVAIKNTRGIKLAMFTHVWTEGDADVSSYTGIIQAAIIKAKELK